MQIKREIIFKKVTPPHLIYRNKLIVTSQKPRSQIQLRHILHLMNYHHLEL